MESSTAVETVVRIPVKEERLSNARKKLRNYRAAKMAKRALPSNIPAEEVDHVTGSGAGPSTSTSSSSQNHHHHHRRSSGRLSSIVVNAFKPKRSSRVRGSIGSRSSLQLADVAAVAGADKPTEPAALPAGPSSASRMSEHHERRKSRHSRQLSVSSFRQSVELMSGVLSSGPSTGPLIGSGSMADTQRLLEALKERGRIESLREERDSDTVRKDALAALEGRMNPNREPIDLSSALGLHIPSVSTTGLGPGPVRTSLSVAKAVGARGALDLGMVEEVDEEEAETMSSPRRSPPGRKLRPMTLSMATVKTSTPVLGRSTHTKQSSLMEMSSPSAYSPTLSRVTRFPPTQPVADRQSKAATAAAAIASRDARARSRMMRQQRSSISYRTSSSGWEGSLIFSPASIAGASSFGEGGDVDVLGEPCRIDDGEMSVDSTTELAMLRAKVQYLAERDVQTRLLHRTERTELQQKLNEETRQLRSRASSLSNELETTRLARKFEIEALNRELAQVKRANAELIEERDVLREDVGGWRVRCQSLEKTARQHEMLIAAQANMIVQLKAQARTGSTSAIGSPVCDESGPSRPCSDTSALSGRSRTSHTTTATSMSDNMAPAGPTMAAVSPGLFGQKARNQLPTASGTIDRTQKHGSFVRNWSFPQKEHLSSWSSNSASDDHAFFQLSASSSLPPLPMRNSVVALPPFLTADLTVDDWEEERVLEGINFGAGPLEMVSSGSSGSSSQSSAAASADETNTQAKAVPAVATSMSENGRTVRFIRKEEQPMPRPSPLGRLDFTQVCVTNDTAGVWVV